MSDLFQAIGGSAAIHAAVDLFYRKVMADSDLAGFFAETDLVEQKDKQVRFLTALTQGRGGNAEQYMQRAHRQLVQERGLNDAHFDAVAGHLAATLEELGVDADTSATVMGAVGGLREAVLDRLPSKSAVA